MHSEDGKISLNKVKRCDPVQEIPPASGNEGEFLMRKPIPQPSRSRRDGELADIGLFAVAGIVAGFSGEIMPGFVINHVVGDIVKDLLVEA